MKYKDPRDTSLDLVVLGAAAVDFVAQVPHLPARDEIVFAGNSMLLPGGSGANISVGAARLGIRVGFLGKLGDDQWGKLIRRSFDEEGVDGSGLLIEANKRSATCFVAVDGAGERAIVSMGGVALLESPSELDPGYFKGIRALCITDARRRVALAASGIARSEGAKVFFNPGGLMIGQGLDQIRPLLTVCDVLILSQKEASKIGGQEDPVSMAQFLVQLGPKVVLVTLGDRGVVLHTRDGFKHIPAFTMLEVCDTTGAGDAFTAGLIAGFIEGHGWHLAARFGCAAAALKARRLGAQAGLPTNEEISHFLAQQN